MNRQETFDTICVIIEGFLEEADVTFNAVEDVAEAILIDLEENGADILEHLDPPVGLERWLTAHGLVLVPIREVPAPKVWAALEEEDDDVAEGELVPALEGQRAELDVPFQVGDYVEYRTAVTGPRGQSSIGSGWVILVNDYGAVVTPGMGQEIWLDPQMDYIKRAVPLHTP